MLLICCSDTFLPVASTKVTTDKFFPSVSNISALGSTARSEHDKAGNFPANMFTTSKRNGSGGSGGSTVETKYLILLRYKERQWHGHAGHLRVHRPLTTVENINKHPHYRPSLKVTVYFSDKLRTLQPL